MKRVGKKKQRLSTTTIVLLSILGFIILAIILASSNTTSYTGIGNVALIPVEGVITSNGASYLGSPTASSQDIVNYIEQANENPSIKVILIEINSPGGSAVASDEIGTAIKKSEKPVISYIREVGASGGYWIASSTDHIIANKMAMTGSIGVISSYLEFSGLMEQYGVSYERLVAGEHKDMGTPLKKLTDRERAIFQSKLDLIHDFFIEEIATNRNMPESKVRSLATGEIYLGVEALKLGLVDQTGDKDAVDSYIMEQYEMDSVNYIVYKKQPSFFDSLANTFSQMSFQMGKGISSGLQQQSNLLLI